MSEDTGGGWRRIGAHLMRVEPPDLVVVRAQGDLSPEDLREMLDGGRQLAAAVGPVLWLSNISMLGNVPPETRKVAARSGMLTFLRASACTGAGPIQRALITLILNAAKLTGRRTTLPPVRFFATEAEGRAWLEDIRVSREVER